MRNVNTKVNGSILTITVDLDAPTQPSSTGKTQIIATSEGNQKVAEVQGTAVYLGLNVYRK